MKRWTGWRAGALGASVATALVTVATARWAEARSARALAVRSARTTAAYLALVAPAGRSGSDYDLPQLLIRARALERLPGWTPQFEVYHGTAPLVHATAAPLAPGQYERLRQRELVAWHDGAALVVLKDRDDWDVVGAVGVRVTSLGGWLESWVLPALALVLLTATLAAGAIGRGPEFRQALRRHALAALVFGAAAYHDVRAAAREATDRWLADTRLLMQEASSRLPESRPTLAELGALAPGGEVMVGDSATTTPRRRLVGGMPRAAVEVRLSSHRWLELRTLPGEAATDRWLVLALGLALLGPLATWLADWGQRAAARPQYLRETATAWGFLAPSALHLALFSFAPVLFLLYVALHRWSPAESATSFVGLANFAQLVRDPLVWTAVRNSAVFALSVPGSLALALALALLLQGRAWSSSLVRTALFLPYICSVVAIALVWQWMYSADFGIINYALSRLGVGTVDWLGNPKTALVALMIVAIWTQVGYQMTLFLAALESIPSTYHEAARVDGASAWRRFWRITFPLLRPVTLFLLVTGVIGAFQVFTFVFVMTDGGPLHATDVVAYRIYQLAWRFLEFGAASALSLMVFVLLFGVTWAQFRILGKRVEYA